MQKLKPHKSVEQIAKKHRMDVSDIQKQLDMGEPIEHEHTKNHKLAMDIALQHLDEIPDYYTRLKKMEASAKKEHKKFKDVTEGKEGLWANIHARRKAGKPPKKPGEKGYPKTLDIEEGLKQARKNVGASKCWTGKVATGTKIKNGKEVPDCRSIKEETGMVRYCPKCAKEETRDACKYGPKYWDMFSTPVALASNSYDPNKPHPANEEKDHEYSMARSELSTIISAVKRLKKKMGKGEGNIEAWVQSKITKAADYLDTAADYVDSGEMKKESVTIQDADGNDYIEFIDLIKPEKIKTFNKFVTEASAAWQRKEGKNPEGGLNKKGIASYRKENPGSNLSLAVTTKPSELKKGSKSANRRKSFCSRMSGMKKKLTSAKTANDPDSRINKSLRKWNC